jgi:lipooligosaccharide transport system permease protein
MIFFKTVYALWYRHYLVWKSMFWSSLTSNVFNPLLFLFSFGFGMGSLIETITIDGNPVVYLAYVVPGMMAYSGMFTASFETSISAFARYYMQSYWDQVLSSPAKLYHLLWGEIFWASTKAMFAVVCVMLIGYAFGGIHVGLNILWTLPMMFLGCLCFAACGMVATSFAKSFEVFSYFFTFWVTPMFIFSGVFFPVTRFPESVQWISYLLPMTHLVDVTRAITVGYELPLYVFAYKLGYIAFITAIAYLWSHHNMKKRIFD